MLPFFSLSLMLMLGQMMFGLKIIFFFSLFATSIIPVNCMNGIRIIFSVVPLLHIMQSVINISIGSL